MGVWCRSERTSGAREEDDAATRRTIAVHPLAVIFAVVGLSESIRAERLAPDEVAQAIVDALHTGIFDAWVPGSLAVRTAS